MKATVNKPLKHMFMGIEIAPGTEIEVEDEITPRGMTQIISPEEYAEIFISVEDIDYVRV
ncbi:hypothetical protein [Paenibacillus gallinarum]|uniref:Uncharacterized protein n=1 Tax=Paenibacillus gallinarum TaxID=2762232 RepID=A0ABR8SW46_9BACL|nr:hypothetical protein [Paenibacillus gallinarum]MBD7967734.1 hypothetical protein [Paenibacillus gallinarum]